MSHIFRKSLHVFYEEKKTKCARSVKEEDEIVAELFYFIVVFYIFSLSFFSLYTSDLVPYPDFLEIPAILWKIC